MNNSSIRNARNHNTVVAIIILACLGTIAGSITLDWEFWVPPLIVCGMIATVVLHVTQYGTQTFRENYYLIFSMLISFYHGIHLTSTYEIVVVSALLMVNVTLFMRPRFIKIMLVECIILLVMQVVLGLREGSMVLDRVTVCKLALHVLGELCIYRGLCVVIWNNRQDKKELEEHNTARENTRSEMEDFLVNISHELRTPVNVINGMTTLILRNENREDVTAIRDAGLRLSRQIEDIQDYSEIQRGEVRLEEDKYMITSILNDIISNYRICDGREELELIVDLDPAVPALLYGDAGKISKVIRHLLSNTMKFTRRGGAYVRVTCIKRDYGINLIIEVTDTGIGMSKSVIDKISRGLFQANTKRNRSTGGIGLGLSIVYGFVRKMNGFVNIESKKGKGTTVRVSIAQEVIDPAPCLSVETNRFINIAFHVSPDYVRSPGMLQFYRDMATNMASSLRLNTYAASSLTELKTLLERGDITHIFMGEMEYNNAPQFFDDLARNGITLAVSAPDDFKVSPGSRVIVMPKPLYGGPIIKVLDGDASATILPNGDGERRPVLDGLRALVVDDEPMNLVVASGLFKTYNMLIDTAESGQEAIDKYARKEYDLVFMDHMMPEMDGVEAMKRIKELAAKQGRSARVIALTANAISGAREMFMKEGFDGFISKPIQINEFERTLNKVLPAVNGGREGGRQ
ncbi:MAG: response regulator [Butyrivibrio sp.]|nr:response regulator [Butyrivibrio sp.]